MTYEEVLLDGQAYESGTIVDTEGEHELIVRAVFEPSESIYYEIALMNQYLMC